MTKDHIRNALIMLFIFNMVLLAQNWRSGNRLEIMIKQNEHDDKAWNDRWTHLYEFMCEQPNQSTKPRSKECQK